MTAARTWLVFVTLASACAPSDDLVDCGDGRLCPAGTVCTATRCANPAAVDACIGIADGQACSGGAATGVCVQGVCTSPGCGNGVVDIASVETCDDGNTVSGDGCTASCELEGCGNGRPDVGELCDDGNVIAHDGCSATCQRELLQWTTLEPSFDDERARASVAFIPARNHVVRFGGVDAYGANRAGTHELVDDHWEPIGTSRSPSARAGAASAYDGNRQRWVLFGGRGSSGALADTWELDGVDWSPRAVSGPPPGEHAMAYDPVGGRVVMYCVDGPVAQTWTFDGTSWTQLTGTMPAARTGTALAYDPTTTRIVLFGGNSGTADLADTWTLVGTTWTPLATTGAPPATSGHALAYDPVRGGVVLQGRVDTWILQGSTWSAVDGTQGRSARGLGLVYDAVRGALVRYGGGSGQMAFDELLQLGPTGWRPIGPPSPLDRTGASFAVDTLRNRLLVFGGDSWAEGSFDQTWAYDASGWQLLATAAHPPASSYGAMAYDAARDRVVAVAADETWEFDGAAWVRITSAINTPYIEGPIVYDADRQRMVTILRTRTYVYDGTDWQVLPVPAIPGGGTLRQYAAAYDTDRRRVMVFDMSDLWELDGDTWIRHAATPSPSVRWGSVMAYDPIRRRLVLCAGNSQYTGKRNDTWEWDGSAWSQATPRGAYGPRETPVMAWLPWAEAILMFGGNDVDLTMHDTWLLRMTELP